MTVLIDGDNHNDPIADATRGILDGHIVLDRKIAAQGRWPAIDVLSSLSRLAHKALRPEEMKIAGSARAMIARFEDSKDLRLIGGYQAGTDAELDRSYLAHRDCMTSLFRSPANAPRLTSSLT